MLVVVVIIAINLVLYGLMKYIDYDEVRKADKIIRGELSTPKESKYCLSHSSGLNPNYKGE